MTAIRSAIQPAIRAAISGVYGSSSAWSPLTLFAASEVGVWYDPSDFSTMYQDSAGTTPVTAVGDPVGKILDKSGNGKHASQATGASRPVLGRTPVGGKRNRIINTDTLSTQSVGTGAVAYTLSFTGTGTITLSGTSTAGPLVGTGAGNRVSLTFTPTAGTLTLTVSGSVTFAQLELGSSATAYQKVAQAYDCTEAGKADCYCLVFDGTDDFLATSAINFSGSDSVSVFTGTARGANTTGEVILELSTSATSNNGAFVLYGEGTSPALLCNFGSKGTVRVNALSPGSYVFFQPLVHSGLGDISGDLSTVRVNGTATDASGDQGTGNYGDYPMYIGRRGGTTLPFTGNLFQVIVRGAGSSSAEIMAAEAYVAGKTGVAL